METFELANPWSYFAAAVLLSLGVRLLLSALKAIKQSYESDTPFLRAAGRNLKGFHPPKGQNSPASDYWFTFILGTLELLTYPVLLAMEQGPGIAAWIGLKAIAQWEIWIKDRAIFNLFLIGNGIIILVSYLVLFPMIIAG